MYVPLTKKIVLEKRHVFFFSTLDSACTFAINLFHWCKMISVEFLQRGKSSLLNVNNFSMPLGSYFCFIDS